MNEKNNNSRLEIKQVINQPYKYGFNTDIESEAFPKGINENIIRLIHKKKNNFLLFPNDPNFSSI